LIAASDVSVAFSELPREAAGQVAEAALGLRGATGEDRAPTGSHSTDTPMTGESAGDSAREGSRERSQRLRRRGAIGLLVSAAAVAVFVTAGMARPSRVSEGRPLNQMESRTLGDGLGKSDSIGEEPRPAVESTDGQDAQTELAFPPALGWAGDPVGAGTLRYFDKFDAIMEERFKAMEAERKHWRALGWAQAKAYIQNS
jgi:hypothetical protein